MPVTLPFEAFLRPAGGSQPLTMKYRPRNLSNEILGQPDVVNRLRGFLKNPHSHSFLFDGETGTGKTSAAFALANEMGIEDDACGGLSQIASGEQTAQSVREHIYRMNFRPLFGSGWQMLIVNECDRMSKPVEVIWLDALETLPSRSIVVFTSNQSLKWAKRLRDRTEQVTFKDDAESLQPWIQALAVKVWQQECKNVDPPDFTDIGMPIMDGDADSMHASFRAALQQLQGMVSNVQWRRDSTATKRKGAWQS